MQDYNVNQVASTIWYVVRMALDIGIVWMLVYYVLKLFKDNSRTLQLIKGIILVVIFNALANLFGLQTISYVTNIFMNWGFLAVIILFSPEIRSALERIGKTTTVSNIDKLLINEKQDIINSIIKAVNLLSDNQIGALICIERSNKLKDYIKEGVMMDSDVSSELLASIFMTTTPLHDGAVIICGKKISCASAYLPNPTKQLPNKFGARHRAALGISEITDSVTIVVSEETSEISIAADGNLIHVTKQQLKDYLKRVFLQEETIISGEENARESLLDIDSDVEIKKKIDSEIKVPFNNRKKYDGNINFDFEDKIETEEIFSLNDEDENVQK